MRQVKFHTYEIFLVINYRLRFQYFGHSIFTTSIKNQPNLMSFKNFSKFFYQLKILYSTRVRSPNKSLNCKCQKKLRDSKNLFFIDLSLKYRRLSIRIECMTQNQMREVTCDFSTFDTLIDTQYFSLTIFTSFIVYFNAFEAVPQDEKSTNNDSILLTNAARTSPFLINANSVVCIYVSSPNFSNVFLNQHFIYFG